jgi:hypothetical protein
MMAVDRSELARWLVEPSAKAETRCAAAPLPEGDC